MISANVVSAPRIAAAVPVEVERGVSGAARIEGSAIARAIQDAGWTATQVDIPNEYLDLPPIPTLLANLR